MKTVSLSNKFILPFLFIAAIMASSCTKEEPSDDPSLKLAFSNDSLVFDTVFATIGSITRDIRIYNPNEKRIKIGSIRLAGGQHSAYTLNIDGESGWMAKDIELDPGDSLYIFVRVRINPNDVNTPFLVKDSIEFLTNGNLQDIKLLAWGQNAHYHTPNIRQEGIPPYSIIDCSQPWTADKPHVIYGWAVVDSASTLKIEAGTRIYFHNNALLLVYRGGSLQITGEAENKVVMRNDRLDPFYRDLPGQWNGIWLSEGSTSNIISHAEILNGNLGIQVDKDVDDGEPQLVLSDTRIGNMKTGGLAGNCTHIVSVNTVIENCGTYALALGGGIYQFTHLTVGNFWRTSTRQSPSLVIKNYFLDAGGNIAYVNPTQAQFVNSVIYGNNTEELMTDGEGQGLSFTYHFDHCLLRTRKNLDVPQAFADCIINEDPLFVNTEKPDLAPDTLSILHKAGRASGISHDILGRVRNPETPAIGAYEPDYGLSGSQNQRKPLHIRRK